MNCKLTVEETSTTKALLEAIGSDMVAFYSYYGNAIQNGDFKPEFKAWYKNKYQTDKVPDINVKAKSKAKDLALAIKQYYAESAHSINDTSRNDKSSSTATTKGYVNEMDREDGKKHSAVIILNDFNKFQNTNSEIKGNKLNHYKLVLKNTWNKNIFKIVADKTGKTIKEVNEDYLLAEDKFDWIDKHLDKEGVLERNLTAVWKELNGSKEQLDKYMNEVFANDILQSVLPEVKNSLVEDYNEELNRDEESEQNEENGTDNVHSESSDDTDTYMRDVTNHIGAYTSFMKHVGPRITNYFNSLPVLSTTDIIDGKYNIDTNNRFGMPLTMDAKACATMLINCGVFNNIDTMIDSIRRIANNVKGFEGFVKLADDLANNTDFATEVFTVFAKELMKRAEVVLENNRGTTKVSNERADASSALFYDLYNDLKGSVVDINHDYALTVAKELTEHIKKNLIPSAETADKTTKTVLIEYFDEEFDKAILDVGSLLMQYFPSVQLTAVQSYVKHGLHTKNDKASRKEQVNALSNLLTRLTGLISKSPKSYMNYLTMEADAREMASENSRKAKKSNGVWSDKQIIEYKDIYNREYIDQTCNTNIIAIKNALLPYTVVNTDFNTRNVYGNNSSSIINSSLITRINKMLNATYKDSKGYLRNKQLEEFATDLVRSNQYKYDNLLFTQYDENGKALNEALFMKDDNGGLIVNERYRDLFDVYLYDGASNIDEGNNVDYTKSTIGDFLPSQFIAYFANKDTGNYFLRTPSDAPKTFCVKGPRYDTSSLFEIKDKEAWLSNRDAIANDFERISGKDYIDNYQPKKVSARDKDAIIKAIIGEGKLFVPSLDSTRKHADKDVYVMMDKDAPDYTRAGYVFEGKIIEHETYNELADYEFVGVAGRAGMDGDIQQAVASYFANKLRSEDVTYKGKTYAKAEHVPNRDHRVYKMIRNQFKQEMLNAADALDHYFETKVIGQTADGNTINIVDVESSTNKRDIVAPKFKDGVSNTKGYKFYHLGKDGKVINPITQGNSIVGYHFGGNVFTSTKFTVNKVDEEGHVHPTNYFKDIIKETSTTEDDGMIHFLYGAGKANLQIVKNTDGKVVDVEFTDSQLETINSKLDDFLIDYANDCFRRASQYKQFFKGVTFDFDTCTDFSINNLIMHYNYDTLFEGDTKFYKDSQTVLKRAKEYQGSGVPYGIVNYDERDSEGIHDIAKSYLNNGVYNDSEIVKEKNADGKIVKKKVPITRNVQDIVNTVLIPDENGELVPTKTEIRQRNKFYAVTIKNTQRTNDVALAELSKYLQKLGKSKDEAETLLYGPVEVKNGKKQVDESTGEYIRRGGFTDTKVNDAQSYITYEEWIRRIAARGQLQRYIPLIKKLNDPNSKLSGNDLKQFVQVQKNFYYDLYYDDRYGIRVPRQIKNAEFVLVPRLIKGTELEKVYKMMKEAGVDQLNTVETSKAANETLLTLWDNDEVLTKEAEDAFVGDAKTYRQLYSYNNLYTQQETPQHMDAQNKMGMQISKKIIDNIPDRNGKIDPRKAAYFKLISRNVYDAYSDFCDEIDIERDERTGDIVLNPNGVEFNKKLFYDKFREELYRRGMDSNMLDYVTLGEDGLPKMPSCMSNNLPVLESAMQAMINSSITRQKLPGFHAAQVTNVGFKSIHENGLKDVTYDTELRYHPVVNGKPQPYIEVKLPASFLGIDKNSTHYKNMSDAEIIKELEETGLDIFLGYRIPTEGKQSVCNMKVVGLLSDAYGSTIVVPNDWVSQTGSDFDIDSVYSIQYETYKTVDSQVKKIKYIGKSSTDNSDAKYEVTPNDYASYIRDFTDKEVVPGVKNKITEARKRVREKLNERYKVLNKAEEDAFDELINMFPPAIKNAFINSFNSVAKTLSKQYEGESKAFIYGAQMHAYVNNLKAFKDANKKNIENNPKIGEAIDNLIKTCDDVYKYLANQSDNYTEDNIAELEELAKLGGLNTYEDYKNGIETNPEQLNTHKARNNEIVNIMKDILMDDSSLEENLSRSNFDKITEALAGTMNIDIKTERNNRSPYNVFDQMAYQEDAMSGAKLKAFSVTLDTFCSVANTVRPKLTEPIYVVYDTSELDEKDFKKAHSGFGTDYIGGYVIKHSMYGWNHNNRNVEGMILTSYSSQTTAYILDAIKEGAIPNVNDYTFAAFKTLANVGVDYETSISFIMQPGVKRIVDAYNASKSIYSGFAANPTLEAVRGIAEELGIATDYKSNVNTVLRQINKRYNKQFNVIFKQEGDEELTISLGQDIPIIASKLLDRLSGKDVKYDSRPVKDVEHSAKLMNSLFDLGVILTFNKLNNTARQIGDIARCCNPDKFGAKQTIFATNKVFEDIDNILHDEVGNARVPVLHVNGKNILESIYPGIDGGLKSILAEDREDESTYPTLYSYLKYATATSVVIGRSVLETQNPRFVSVVNSLGSTFSGMNHSLDEATYNDFQKYVLTHYYNNVESIARPVSYSLKENRFVLDNDGDVYDERRRIYGYSQPASMQYIENTVDEKGNIKSKYKQFTVANPVSPTQEELDIFARLSPAQKVQWIKSTFEDAGVFNYIQAQLYNNVKRGAKVGMQTLEYTQERVNPNVMYNLFYKAFYNENPLISMAAFDVVKYAAQVEGFRTTARAVSKVIDNDVLMEDFGRDGTGFVGRLNQMMHGTDEDLVLNENNTTRVCENYLRGHLKNTKGIRTLYLSKSKMKKYGLINHTNTYGMLSTTVNYNTKAEEADKAAKQFVAMLDEMGVRYKFEKGTDEVEYRTNKYVKIKFNNSPVELYKIYDLGTTVLLAPFNSLNPNEDAIFSARNDYNKHPDIKYYDAIAANFAEKMQHTAADYKALSDVINVAREEKKDFEWAKKQREEKKVVAAEFDINKLADISSNSWTALRNQLGDMLEKQPNETHYIYSRLLGSKIYSPGAEFGSVQRVKLPNGKYREVIISRVDSSKRVARNPKEGERVGYKHSWNGTFLDQTISKKEREERINLISNPEVKKIYHDANQYNAKYLNEIFEVVPQGEQHAASLEDANLIAYQFANLRMKSTNQESAVETVEALRSNGISNTKQSVKENSVVATRKLAKFANAEMNEIKTNFEQFTRNPDDTDLFISMTDDRVQDLLAKNKELEDKFINTLNRISAFKTTFAEYRDFDYNSEDLEIKHHLDSIKESLARVEQIPADEANDKFVRKRIASLSTNPLIKEQVIDVMDNYWKTYGSMWMFHDIAENGNPLLQIILKDVFGDMESRRMMTEIKKREFEQKVKDIIKAAAKEGINISLNDVIDEHGRLVQDYSNKFIDKIVELRDAVNDARRKDGYGSLTYLKAKNNFDKFTAIFINQEAKPEYYLRKAGLEANMIEHHPTIYAAYMKLFYEKMELYSGVGHNNLTEEEQQQVLKIRGQMSNLSQLGGYYDESGEFVQRPRREENIKYTPEMEAKLQLYGYDEAAALAKFTKDLKALNGEYFKYDADFGFDEQVEKYLNIIADAEQRRNGVPTIPISQLEQNVQYMEAKNWLNDNAMFVIKDDIEEANAGTGLISKINAAYHVLSLGSKGKTRVANEIMYNANNGKGIFDVHHIPNGMLLTDEQRDKIKIAQEIAFGTRGLPAGSDRVLITNATPGTEAFNSKFYEGLVGNPNLRKDEDYIATVTELNKKLEKYYDEVDGVIHFDRLQDNAESIKELNEIGDLYAKLKKLRKGNKGQVADYITFETNKELYNTMANALSDKSAEFKDAWARVNIEQTPDGKLLVKDKKYVPNRLLYSYARPKAEKGSAEYNKYVDTAKTDAINLLNSVYRTVPTTYFYQAMHEAMNKQKADSNFSYADWYKAQHIYNPYTRRYELLECWTNREAREELFHGYDEAPSTEKPFRGQYIPAPNNRTKHVIDGSESGAYIKEDDKRNPNYKKDATLAENYIIGSKSANNVSFDNEVKLNKYQKELRDLVYDTLKKTAKINSAQKYFNKGYLPMQRAAKEMNGKQVVKEVGKMFGIDLDMADNGKKEFYDEVGYETDITPNMPMTEELVSKDVVKVAEGDNLEDALASERTIRYNVPRPKELSKVEEWQTNVRKVKEHNRLVAESLMNKDWDTVLSNYILKAGSYNAVLANKDKLYYLLNMLQRQQAYARKYGFTGSLKEDTRRSTEDNKAYVSSVDENLIKQYKNLLNRLFWEQYKQPESKLTKLSNGLQGFTSANYMMLNLRGGIANVTVGFQSILGEALAGEAFDKGSWGAGLAEWQKGMFGMIQGYGKTTAYNKQDATVKLFQTVDYDGLSGVVTEVGLQEKFKRVRDLGFSTQSGGEHLMQNSVLFAMLKAHKIIAIADDPKAIGYTYMNKNNYITYKEGELLMEFLTDEQKKAFAEEKKKITEDKSKTAAYAWFRKDMLTEFVARLSKEQRKAFGAKRKEIRKKLTEEFDKLPDIYSQIELGEDGYAKFKEGSQLDTLNKQFLDNGNTDVTKAIALIGNLSEKVRKTNNKIHGAYNKLARAFIERTWYGNLVMQYHKHLPMGLMKRYMTRGHWNEFRQSVDKGMVASFMDFMNLNLETTATDLGYSKDELDALKSLQIILKNGVTFLSNIKTTWSMMPEYERANIRRNLGDLVGVLGGIMIVIALKAAGDDDDDSILYNLALYEGDRLTSESFMYNPLGLMTETKTLMSTPLAAQSIVTDAGKAIYEIGAMVMQGDDFEPIYKSGRFAGENKLSVYIQRRIPMWNGVRTVIDAPENNHYYKLGDTAATLVPTGSIAEWIKNQ